MKVGQNVEDDRRRCAKIREIIGYDKPLVRVGCVRAYLLELNVDVGEDQ